jgi:hypothetical protein
VRVIPHVISEGGLLKVFAMGVTVKDTLKKSKAS